MLEDQLQDYLKLSEPYQKFNKLNEELLYRIASADAALQTAARIVPNPPSYMETLL